MDKQKKGGFLDSLATFIVEKRNLFFLLYLFVFLGEALWRKA